MPLNGQYLSKILKKNLTHPLVSYPSSKISDYTGSQGGGLRGRGEGGWSEQELVAFNCKIANDGGRGRGSKTRDGNL